MLGCIMMGIIKEGMPNDGIPSFMIMIGIRFAYFTTIFLPFLMTMPLVVLVTFMPMRL